MLFIKTNWMYVNDELYLQKADIWIYSKEKQQKILN